MNRTTTMLIGVLLSGALASVAAWAHEADKEPPAAQSTSHGAHSPASMELQRVMMQRPKMHMPMSGDIDKDFATMMTMHHEQAIKMADVLLQHGRNAELKALARKMQQEQREEIKQLAPHTK